MNKTQEKGKCGTKRGKVIIMHINIHLYKNNIGGGGKTEGGGMGRWIT